MKTRTPDAAGVVSAEQRQECTEFPSENRAGIGHESHDGTQQSHDGTPPLTPSQEASQQRARARSRLIRWPRTAADRDSASPATPAAQLLKALDLALGEIGHQAPLAQDHAVRLGRKVARRRAKHTIATLRAIETRLRAALPMVLEMERELSRIEAGDEIISTGGRAAIYSLLRAIVERVDMRERAAQLWPGISAEGLDALSELARNAIVAVPPAPGDDHPDASGEVIPSGGGR